MCMIFYRRDTHIAEIQMGLPAARLEDACTVDNFDVMKLPYVTLVGKLNTLFTLTAPPPILMVTPIFHSMLRVNFSCNR